MRLLTSEQLDALSWKERKLYFLEKYAEDAERWVNESDDRRLFCNIYNHMVEAIESLEDNPHIFVIVAMNSRIAEERDILDSIQEHFRDR